MDRNTVYAVIAGPLHVWTRGTGRNMARKEIDTLRWLGIPVSRNCRIAENGAVYRGDRLLDIVIARNFQELGGLLDRGRGYQIFQL